MTCWFLLYSNVSQLYTCPLPLEPPPLPQHCAVFLFLLDFLSLSVLPQELFYVGSKFCAGVQPWWIQGIRRGDSFGDQDTIELKI